MHPTCNGVIRGQDHGCPTQLSVVGAVLTPETTIHILRFDDGGVVQAAHVEITEQDRVELIELLGGTA